MSQPWTYRNLAAALHARDIGSLRSIIAKEAPLSAQSLGSLAADGTPLMLAAGSGWLEAISMLVASGSPIDEAEFFGGMNPLLHAISLRKFEAAELLLALGASRDAEEFNGYGALHVAAQDRGAPEAIAFLAARGPWEVDKQAAGGVTALGCAAADDNVLAIRALIRMGANFNLRAPEGCPPLVMAVETSAFDAVDELLRLGADPNADANDGSSPLSMAIWRDDEALIRTLLEAGADPRRPTREGRLADLAQQNAASPANALVIQWALMLDEREALAAHAAQAIDSKPMRSPGL